MPVLRFQVMYRTILSYPFVFFSQRQSTLRLSHVSINFVDSSTEFVMANTKDFFLKITETVLSNWTALKLAVEHGMGSRERAEEFSVYITEVFHMNENLDSDDIAAEIEEYMDNAFQTELQDDSAADVANELLRFHKYCMEGDNSMAVAELAKLPPLDPWILGRRPAREDRQHLGQQVMDETRSNDEAERMEAEEGVEDEGWTEVKTRRQK